MAFKDIPIGSVIVIGGCGLLGHCVVKYLLENGSSPKDITVFDISTRNNRYANVMYIAGDLANKNELSAAFDSASPNVIINVASPDAMTPDKSVFSRCNVTGVQNIIELAQEKGIRVLVHTSSSEVVQDSYHDLVFVTEDAPVLDNPVNGSVYAKTKAIGEAMVMNANREEGLLTTAIRLTTLFGEGDVVVTRHFIELGRSGKMKFQVGANTNLYDFCYAMNAAECHILAAKALLYAAQSSALVPKNERVDGEVFNLSDGDPWYFWDIARFVSTTAGYPIAKKDVWTINMEVACFFLAIWEWVYWMATFGGTAPITTRMLRYTAQQRTFDITKARKRLGYKPRVEMKEALEKSVEFFLARERELEGKPKRA